MNDFVIPQTYDRVITHSINELSVALTNDFGNRRVYITEKLRGLNIRFSFSNKEAKFFLKNTELKVDDPLYKTLYEYCEKKHFKAFGNMYKEFSNNPLVLFFELINNNLGIKYFEEEKIEMFLIDIYVNTNWVNWDDVQAICSAEGISCAPLVYEGLFSQEAINQYLIMPSILNASQPKEGLIIKPLVEDYSSSSYNNRLIAKVTLPQFKKAEPIVVSVAGSSLVPVSNNRKSAGEYFILAGTFIDKNITELEPLLWEELLKVKKIEVKKENINKIMPELVKDFLDDLEQKKEIDRFCKEKELDVNKLVKALKRMLPARIRKELKF